MNIVVKDQFLTPIPNGQRAELDALLGRSTQLMKIWLVHDWLTGMRGGEKVVLELIRLFPNARIATLFYRPGSIHPAIESRIVCTSWLQKVPGISKHYRKLLPLMPLAIKTLHIDACDLVISTSHCVAKNIATQSPHLCHCFTPMRYIWDMQDSYLKSQKLPSRWALKALTPWLRQIDTTGHQSVGQFIGTCQNVCARVTRTYQRPCAIVHSPIDESYWLPARDGRRDYFLIVSALVAYKRIDLAVDFFCRIAAKSPQRFGKLVIIGTGPELPRLKACAAEANGGVQFLGWQNDETVRWHYQNCRALIFPGEEDFGLVPIEAMACGRPIIAFGQGGVLETATGLRADSSNRDSATAIFFEHQTLESLTDAMDRFCEAEEVFTPERLHATAMRFSRNHFHRRICELSASLLSGKTNQSQ